MSVIYELLDEDYVGNQLIKLTSDGYSGIIYSYGKVDFVEEGYQLRLKFEYDIHENPVGFLEADKFKNYIGDILVELIESGLMKNNLVFTGGIDDENRTADPYESDL